MQSVTYILAVYMYNIQARVHNYVTKELYMEIQKGKITDKGYWNTSQGSKLSYIET